MLGAARRDQEGRCTTEVAQPDWQLGFRSVSLYSPNSAVSTKLGCRATAAPRHEHKPWVFAFSPWSLALSRNWFLPYGCHPLHSSVPLSRVFPITLKPIKTGTQRDKECRQRATARGTGVCSDLKMSPRGRSFTSYREGCNLVLPGQEPRNR